MLSKPLALASEGNGNSEQLFRFRVQGLLSFRNLVPNIGKDDF